MQGKGLKSKYIMTKHRNIGFASLYQHSGPTGLLSFQIGAMVHFIQIPTSYHNILGHWSIYFGILPLAVRDTFNIYIIWIVVAFTPRFGPHCVGHSKNT